MKQPSWKKRKG